MRGFLLLLAAVLGAIGIGVGVESAVRATSYGPSAAPFTAAFGGQVTLLRPRAPSKTGAGGGQKSGILRYLKPTRTSRLSTYSYTSSWNHEELTVNLVLRPAVVPTPSAIGTGAIAGYRNGVVFYQSDPSVRRPLTARVVILDGRRAVLGVACLPADSAHPAGSCSAVVAGLQTASETAIATWSAIAWAPTAAQARALANSLRPLNP